MISVSWTCADGRTGSIDLVDENRWSIGRGGEPEPTVVVDEPMVSRLAMVVRDTDAGPVVFRGQRENGARVTIVGPDGAEQWLDEGVAGHLTEGLHRVELVVRDVVVVALDVVVPASAKQDRVDLSA